MFSLSTCRCWLYQTQREFVKEFLQIKKSNSDLSYAQKDATCMVLNFYVFARWVSGDFVCGGIVIPALILTKSRFRMFA